jgi:RDD family.
MIFVCEKCGKNFYNESCICPNCHELHVITEEDIQNEKINPEGWIAEPVPWRRYFAKMLDIECLLLPIAIVMVKLLNLFPKGYLFSIFGNSGVLMFCWIYALITILIGYFAWIYIDAYIVLRFNNTLGRWLFNIRLESTNEHPLTFKRLVKRNSLIILRGFGLLIPVVSIVTLIVSLFKVSNNILGQTSWDKDTCVIVKNKDANLYKVILLIVLIILFSNSIRFI